MADKFRWIMLVVAACATVVAQGNSSPPNGQNVVPSGETVSITRLRHKIPAKALALFQRGVKLALTGDARQAALAFQGAASIDPVFSEAFANLGVEYTATGNLEQAVVAFRSAIEIDASTSRYHSNLAYTLYLLNRLVEGESEARKAVALDRTDPSARYMLGFLIAAHPEMREEAFQNLLYAARQIREARLVLATLYHLTGADVRAGAELQLYHTPSLMADLTH